MESGDPGSSSGGQATNRGKLMTQLSGANFNPPTWAEPGTNEEDASSQPTVLSKLQKWGDYHSVGEAVRPTKFIPMKTPMSREIISNWSLGDGPKHSLTVPELLAQQHAKGRDVGMIIDLANHECLYREDVPDSVEYAHVQLIAKVLPPPEAICEVAGIANEFWGRHPDKFIAIHCAYGFNRTGFVVCAYLIQWCGLSVEQAMENFAEARAPGVKHEKFINELYLRYGGRGRGGGSRSSSGGGTTEQRQHDGGAAAAVEEGAGAHSRACSRQGGDGSLSESGEQQDGGSGCAAAGLTSQGSGSVRQVPTRGGISLAVESSEGSGVGEEPEPPGDLQPSSDLGAEADHLQSGRSMRRSTSLGLAKALCEDFSMFDGTPVRPSPLQLAVARESAFAYMAGLPQVDSPGSPVRPWDNPTISIREPGGSEPPCPSGAAAATAAAAAAHACSSAGAGQQPDRCGGAAAASPCHQEAEGCSWARGNGAAAAAPCGSAAGAGPAAQCRPGGGRLGPPVVRSTVVSSGHSGTHHHHTLPPLPYSTPAVVGAGASKPMSPSSSCGVMDAGGSLAFGGPRRSTTRFIRSMSAESDNQSLGFGARQAIMHLRGEHDSPAGNDRPLALYDLFNTGSGEGLAELDGCSERSECEWEEKPSVSKAESLAHSRGSSLQSYGAGQQPPSQPPPHPAAAAAAQHQKQPQPRLRGQRNGTSRCKLM